MLQADSITFWYGKIPVLSNVHIHVKKGEVVGFLGRNGCGKSTLLKVIFGSLIGETQSIFINGQYYKHSFESKNIVFLPQETMLPSFLTPRKAAKLFNTSISNIESEDTTNYLDSPFTEISAGLKKYIETLILLYSPAEYVLMDEPFSFLAPALVEKLIPKIRDVSKNKGIIVTDHQYRSILTTSDRLYLMKDHSLQVIQGERELRDLGYLN